MHLRRRTRRPARRRDERGIAMVTALGVTFIVGVVGVTSVELSRHAVNQSRRGRDRVAALHAAEAGVNRALGNLAGIDGASWCGEAASASTRLPGAAGAPGRQQYATEVSDSLGVPGTCSPADPVRLVRATGWSPSATAPDAISRVMEAQVRLAGRYSRPDGGVGFTDALFSSSDRDPIGIANSVTVLGDGGGNNGDVYSNAGTRLVNSNEIHGDVVSQGSVVLGNYAHVYGSIHAVGDVTLTNNVLVEGDVTSSTGSITLDNSARIVGNARAASTVTRNGSSVISGAVYPSSPSSPPPHRLLPTFDFDAGDTRWPQPVVTHSSCAGFETYLAANASSFGGTHRITSDCGVDLSNNRQYLVPSKAAIVTDGWIAMRNSARFVGTGAGSELWLISLHGRTGPGDANGVSFRNSSSVDGMPVFVYARNIATKANSVALSGQIYAERINVANAYEHTYRPLAPIGFTEAWAATPTPALVGYEPRLLYLREVL